MLNIIALSPPFKKKKTPKRKAILVKNTPSNCISQFNGSGLIVVVSVDPRMILFTKYLSK